MSTPTEIGRYAVKRRLGTGAFASVWLAFDHQLDSPVAIKVLADNWSAEPDVRRRFVDEGRFLRKVESPHVVSVYDAGELDDGRPYLVMRYADRGTLKERVEGEPLPLDEALEMIGQVGRGLVTLHQRGVIHRDVKPANVLFRSTADGDHAMLGDLGLGKVVDGTSRATVLAGTPSYAAPEQARGEKLDPRADQFSLGVISYLALVGKPPFDHPTLLAAAKAGEPPELPDVPPEIAETVRRALSPDRTDRWPDVASYLRALDQASREIAAEPDPPVEESDPPVEEVAQRPSRNQGSGKAVPLTKPDPGEATFVGARPEPSVTEADLDKPPRPLGVRAKVLIAVAAVAVVAAAAGGGYLGERQVERTEVLRDADGVLSVTVPEDWAKEVSREGWTPPGADRPYPALSIEGDDRALFVGLVPADQLPEKLPGHPECETTRATRTGFTSQGTALTATYEECPGVVVERVVEVTNDRLLWVQVRAADRDAAMDIVESASADL
ncbi:serine/threonine-protein kinase [Nocardioides speluncae]|uniref:serine/threonine-protein kinase n=1 Tax=Nocardioides speluncae TaxID=2670337 RepID=UPI000D68B766|nr:serine/threonine-protein kinase [Nocardioides speluncae]